MRTDVENRRTANADYARGLAEGRRQERLAIAQQLEAASRLQGEYVRRLAYLQIANRLRGGT